MPTPLVLAIEPDLRQAAILKRIVREKVGAEVSVVDSRDAAIDAMRTAVPDVLLISALLSPRDEDDLIAHLRTLEDAAHLQTHTIPQLASALGPGEGRSARGLLSAFRRKKESEAPPSGCDPDFFASEIRTFLEQAAEKKRDLAYARASGATSVSAQLQTPPAAPADEASADATEPASSWSSPFEWRPTSDRSSHPPDRSSRVADPRSKVSGAAKRTAVTPPAPAEPAVESIVFAAPAAHEKTAGPMEEHRREESVLETTQPDTVEPIGALEVEAKPAAIHVVEPIHATDPAPVDAPIHLTEAVPVEESVHTSDIALVAQSAPDAFETREPEYAQPAESVLSLERTGDRGPGTRDSIPGKGVRDKAFRIGDPRFAIQDQGSAIRDRRLGPLASWARAEGRAADASQPSGELRGLLSSLAVPPAVAGVRYAAGCRIRRVRVAPAREGGAKGKGAVILSKRLLSELREQPPA